jgi:HSP20 family protein
MASKSWLPTWGDHNRDVEHVQGFKTQIDTLFEDWFGRSMGGVLARVAEDDQNVTLTAELPGVKESDIDVSLKGDQLTIKGEKRSEHDEKKEIAGHTVHRVERSYSAFQRTLTVSYEVDPDLVSARFQDGVLTITLPKPPDSVTRKEGRKIEVRAMARDKPINSVSSSAQPHQMETNHG